MTGRFRHSANLRFSGARQAATGRLLPFSQAKRPQSSAQIHPVRRARFSKRPDENVWPFLFAWRFYSARSTSTIRYQVNRPTNSAT